MNKFGVKIGSHPASAESSSKSPEQLIKVIEQAINFTQKVIDSESKNQKPKEATPAVLVTTSTPLTDAVLKAITAAGIAIPVDKLSALQAELEKIQQQLG